MGLDATAQGIVLGILGVMNPTGIPRANPYPDAAGLRPFVRDLVGRMHDVGVVYSPSFDDRWKAQSGEPGRCGLIRSTGVELKNALRGNRNIAKKNILAVHLAGGATSCDDYRAVATGTDCATGPSTKWLNYYFFQSGHGGGNGTTGACPAGIPGDSDLENAMRRAYEMPKQLISYAAPKLSATNAEGPYDSTNFTPNPHPGIDERVRVRQAAYLSALSGATGFTYGAHRMSIWWQPETAFGLLSADDMGVFKDHVVGRGLQQKFALVLNQPAEQEFKRVLAGVGTELLVGYLPGREDPDPLPTLDPPNAITIATGAYADLTCGSESWSVTWYDPTNNNTGIARAVPLAERQPTRRSPCRDPRAGSTRTAIGSLKSLASARPAISTWKRRRRQWTLGQMRHATTERPSSALPLATGFLLGKPLRSARGAGTKVRLG
jgi:hypothetical protein